MTGSFYFKITIVSRIKYFNSRPKERMFREIIVNITKNLKLINWSVYYLLFPIN